MRPLRFGLVWNGRGSPVEVARRAEDVGYGTLLFPDHTGMVAPLPAMAAAAAVTSTIRVGPQVINIAFRPLGMLAQELAAVDVISGGRLDIGLGAGYAEAEVTSLGLPFPGAGARVRAVERALDVLPRLFAGETVTGGDLTGYRLDPAPPQGAAVPLMVGANGDRQLAIAAARADVVQLVGFTPGPAAYDFGKFSMDGLDDRIAHVREHAGARFADIELSVLVQWGGVVPDPAETVAGLGEAMPVEQVLASPFTQLGRSVDEVCDRIVDLRDRHGVSFVSVFDGRSPGFDEVVTRLAGT